MRPIRLLLPSPPKCEDITTMCELLALTALAPTNVKLSFATLVERGLG